MADAIAAPVPAAGSPAVKTAVVPVPKVVEPSPQIVADRAKVELESERAKFAEFRKIADRKMALAQRKYADTDATQKKTWGEKLSRLEMLEKERANARLDPESFFKSAIGDDWYDVAVGTKVNAGVPTAGTVQSELAKVRDEFKAQLEADKAARAKADDERAAADRSAAAKREDSEARMGLARAASEMWAKSGDKFKEISILGAPAQIVSELCKQIEAHYFATLKKDEDGVVIEEGKILGLHEAATLWEGRLAEHQKKREERFRPSPKDVSTVRRTLTNDLTGSTQTRVSPAATEAERLERSLAARQKYLDEKTR